MEAFLWSCLSRSRSKITYLKKSDYRNKLHKNYGTHIFANRRNRPIEMPDTHDSLASHVSIGPFYTIHKLTSTVFLCNSAHVSRKPRIAFPLGDVSLILGTSPVAIPEKLKTWQPRTFLLLTLRSIDAKSIKKNIDIFYLARIWHEHYP